jgi:hypothetical protein
MQVFHASVSSSHALIEVNGTDSIDVVDCGSSNGTFVNGIQVVDRRPISAGDLLRFANAEFRVSADLDFTGEDEAGQDAATGPIFPGQAVLEKGDDDTRHLHADSIRDLLAAEVASLKAEHHQGLSRAAADAAQLARKESEIGFLRGENEALVAQLAGLEDVIRRLNREIEDGAQREQRLLQQLSESRNTLMDREGSIAALNYEISRRDGTIRQLGEQQDQLRQTYDQSVNACAALQSEMAQQNEELNAALAAREFAEVSASGIVARLFQLSGRLLGDWRTWFRDAGHGEESADPEVAFARVEEVAGRIRGELDLIEPIWHQFGEGVQEELRQRCERLREEEAGLIDETEARRVELAGVMESLEQFREVLDTEVRRAQGLSRRGTEIEIPERFESMVIARDHEQEIYRSLIERIEILDRLLEGYRGSRKLKEVVAELDEFRARLGAILESSGVHLFDLPLRTILTLKHRKEVQILSRKGWGTRQYTEYPFQPGEVTKVIRPGYRVGEGEYAVILRKVEVLIRGVDE